MGRPAARLVGDFYGTRNLDPARAQVSFCLDPIGAFAFTGKLIETETLARPHG